MFVEEGLLLEGLLKGCATLQKKLNSVKRNKKLAGRLSVRLKTIVTVLNGARENDLPELRSPPGKNLLQEFDKLSDELTKMIDTYSAEPKAFLVKCKEYLGKIKHGSDDMAEFLEKEFALEQVHQNLLNLFRASMPNHAQLQWEKDSMVLQLRHQLKEDLESDKQARVEFLQKMFELSTDNKDLNQLIWQISKDVAQRPIPIQPALNVNVREIAFKDLKFESALPLGRSSPWEVHVGTWSGAPVAIKKFIGRNLDEVIDKKGQVYASVSHPHVIQLYGVVHNPEPCLVMKYAKEGSLRDALCQGKLKSPFQALSIFKGVVAGLIYLHDCHVVHGNLKAANVLLTSSDLMHAEIADFGLDRVKSASSRCSTYPSYVGRLVHGSLPWQAPEVLKSGQHTFAGDVYACGMILFEMCTLGKIPFQDARDIYVAVVNRNERERLPKGTPDDLVKLFKSMTDPQPVCRPTLSQVYEAVVLMLPKYAIQHTTVQNPTGNGHQGVVELFPPKCVMADTTNDKCSSNVMDASVPRFLATVGLTKYSNALEIMGVRSLDDLNYVDEEIMTKCGFTDIEKRKFQKKWPPSDMPSNGATVVSTDHSTLVATCDVAALERSQDFQNLTKALVEGDSDTRTAAAAAIRNITTDNESRRAKAAEAGCLTPLVSLLRDGTAEGKTAAAGAIMSIAWGDDNRKAKALEAGCLPPLVSLLRDGTTAGKTAAAGAIMNIAAGGKTAAAGAMMNIATGSKTAAAGAMMKMAARGNNLQVKTTEAGGVSSSSVDWRQRVTVTLAKAVAGVIIRKARSGYQARSREPGFGIRRRQAGMVADDDDREGGIVKRDTWGGAASGHGSKAGDTGGGSRRARDGERGVSVGATDGRGGCVGSGNAAGFVAAAVAAHAARAAARSGGRVGDGKGHV